MSILPIQQLTVSRMKHKDIIKIPTAFGKHNIIKTYIAESPNKEIAVVVGSMMIRDQHVKDGIHDVFTIHAKPEALEGFDEIIFDIPTANNKSMQYKVFNIMHLLYGHVRFILLV